MVNLKGILRSLNKKQVRLFSTIYKDASELPIHEYAVSKKTYNRIFVWGHTKSGALGIPYIRTTESYDLMKDFHRPKRMGFGEKNEVTQVACGFGFSLFSTKNKYPDKLLYGTGLNTDSQIGYHDVRQGKPLEILFYPKPIELPFKNTTKCEIKKIAAGRAHSLILTHEGLYLLGNNAYGQCGRPIIQDEDYSRSNYIHYIENLDGKEIIDIECGQDHSLALTEDGCVYSCGWGADGQTGLGHYEIISTFTKIKGDISTERIVKLNSRCDFVMALNDKGEVFGWGNTEYGQVILENNSQQLNTPTYLKMLKPLGKIIDIAAGGSFCMVLNDDHRVFSWGFGLLGFGPNILQCNEPTEIPEVLFGKNDFQPDNIVEKIYCGVGHSLALTSKGDLYSWGRNRNGCLGLGDEHDQYFPLKVCLGGIVKNVSCGIDHTIAVSKPFL
ncbi:RCC1-like G exchanging factor-like protein [Coccinella septempunctata]|uniref:RCC1-like G exchanging factor-like protein n=1 Tax=Coccinella septempunctata TaxID=41139 RepID=UPI001D0694DE|nr:RCC1-like G exchanging factor-like protein [Coccinella septempunctata]